MSYSPPGPSDNKCRKLNIVQVCINYSDFLACCLHSTVAAADELIVVTSKEDKATQALCNRIGVRYVTTWVHDKQGRFDKAAAINVGLDHLPTDGWTLQLDADILLPIHFGSWFRNTIILEDHEIYGVDRFNIYSYEDYEKITRSEWYYTQLAHNYLVNPPPVGEFGTRVGTRSYGMAAIGYFQLFSRKTQPYYPTKSDANGAHTDLLLSSYYHPKDRVLIPDFFVTHLSTSKNMGINWAGRKSEQFKKINE